VARVGSFRTGKSNSRFGIGGGARGAAALEALGGRGRSGMPHVLVFSLADIHAARSAA
jgi:hypothetical protein